MSSQKYKQPEFYHFSRDSIDLADYVVNLIREQGREVSVCDYFSGSGIIGIEITLKSRLVKSLSFVEKQEVFHSVIAENMANFLPKREFSIRPLGLENSSYDYIVANPPYFLEGQGRSPSDNRKKICHFMSEADWIRWKDWARDNAQNVFFLGRLKDGPDKSDCYLEKKLSDDVGIFSLKETF